MLHIVRETDELCSAEALKEIVARLRDPEQGCPWDKVQTHQSIRMNFLEEAYEAVDAIDLDDPHLMCEELGDVLMQVVFHAQIEEEAGRFGWRDICQGVCRKLMERHPHIFGPNDSTNGINDWDALKNKEKGREELQKDLEDVPRAMPALMRASKLQKRASYHGCHLEADAEKIAVLAAQAAQSEPQMATEQKIGELLFEIVCLARDCGVDPEQALQRWNEGFVQKSQK